VSKKQKNIFLVLVLIGIVYFLIFLLPNSKGAKNPDMVSIFAPDEAIQYGHPLRMLSGGASLKDTVRKFIFYQHYYYGFPFYIASVALALLPIKLISGLENTVLNMLWMRQMVSVLPMIAAIMVLVYLQTRFKRWVASIAVFIFLLTIPAVFENSTWWHPDSLTVLFIALTFFFLDRDNLTFGPNFYIAAIACGMATATKLLGLFFFLAIPLYILIGMKQKEINWKKGLQYAVFFVLVMLATFIIANPFLLESGNRQFALDIQTNQARSMSSGWSVFYEGGPLAWYPMIKEYYGSFLFIALAFLVAGLCIWKTRRDNHRRLLNILIIAWTIPYLLYVLFVIVIKPHHFLLGTLLPLFSSLAAVFIVLPLPEISKEDSASFRSQIPRWLTTIAVVWIIGAQFVHNISLDAEYYMAKVNKEEENEVIKFFNELEEDYLTSLPADDNFKVLRDVRAYFPRDDRWTVSVRTRPITYEMLRNENAQIVMIWNQRALDYTAPGTLENAIDRDFMEQAFDFYSDVREASRDNRHSLDGYTLLYQTACCSAFIIDEIYEQYFVHE